MCIRDRSKVCSPERDIRVSVCLKPIAQEYCARGLCNPVYFTVGNLLSILTVSFVNKNTSTTSSSFEQLDDVLDGAIGLVEGRFELAVGPLGIVGPMVKEAVGKRAAELFMEEDEKQRNLGSFFGEAIDVALSVACEQPCLLYTSSLS